MNAKEIKTANLEGLKAQNDIANTVWLDTKTAISEIMKKYGDNDLATYILLMGKLDVLRGMCKTLAAEEYVLSEENARLTAEVKTLKEKISEMEKES